MGILSAFFLNRKINRDRKKYNHTFMKALTKKSSTEHKKKLIGDLSRLTGENAVWAFDYILSSTDPSIDVRRESALALNKIVKRIGWNENAVTVSNLQFFAILENWKKCSEIFIQGPSVLSPDCIGVSTCVFILEHLHIQKDRRWDEALSKFCSISRDRFHSLSKEHPDSLLYPYAVIAWAKTGSLDSIKDLLSVAQGGFRATSGIINCPTELRHAFDTMAPHARSLLLQFGEKAVSSIVEYSVQGTQDIIHWGDLDFSSRNTILALGEKAIGPLQKIAIRMHGGYRNPAATWLKEIEEGRAPNWN